MKSAVKNFKGLSDKAIAWIFITPTLILLLAINVYPLIYAIRMSFTNFYANKIGREPTQPPGLAHRSSLGDANTVAIGDPIRHSPQPYSLTYSD